MHGEIFGSWLLKGIEKNPVDTIDDYLQNIVRTNKYVVYTDNNYFSPRFQCLDQIVMFNADYSFVRHTSVTETLDYIEYNMVRRGKNSQQKKQFKRSFNARLAEFIFKVNVLKFYQNKHLARALAKTGRKEIIIQSKNGHDCVDYLTAKVLMMIRSWLVTSDETTSSDYRCAISDGDLYNLSDSIDDDYIKYLIREIESKGFISTWWTGIKQSHPLSHHYGDNLRTNQGTPVAQIAVMTYDYDLWLTTSAIRVYGTIKLLFYGLSKDNAYKYLEPTCSIGYKDRGYAGDEWERINSKIAFKANLLRYSQNPYYAEILEDTQDEKLICFTDPKWNDTTPEILMVIRHIIQGHDIDY